MLKGIPVTLEDMMQCREQRARTQQKYIEMHHAPVLSFCMNIPGPIKTNPEIRALFEKGKEQIFSVLEANQWSVLELTEFHAPSGDELILCTTANAELLKKAMTDIEESHPLGRLFDIDILDTNGIKLSRPVYRKCLICDKQAQECARSRTHSIEEMQNRIMELLSSGK